MTITLHQAERDLIERTIAAHPAPVAAKLLGVSCRTLYRKVARHKIENSLRYPSLRYPAIER